MSRGTSNSNARGNTRDRAARKRWLLREWAADFSKDTSSLAALLAFTKTPACRCYRCGALLVFATLTVDRIVPGCRGGKYTRGNIRPACADCNSEHGGGLRG